MINNRYIIKSIPQIIIEIALSQSNNKPKVMTSNTISSGIIKDRIFYKKLNTEKIKNLYKGNYIELWENNYEILSKILPLNQVYGIIETEDESIYEFSEAIEEDKFLSGGAKQTWSQFEDLYIKILNYINTIIEYQKESKKIIGIETAIWNFTIDGKLFDLDPPRLLQEQEDSSFTKKHDINQAKRTIYRNFTEIGMKTNLLATTIIGMRDGNFSIPNLPNNWLDILIQDLIESIPNINKRNKMIKVLNGEKSFNPNFTKHPIDIILKEKQKGKEQNEEEER